MAMFLRKRWIERPPEAVQLDFSHPIVDGMASFWDFREGGGLTTQDRVSVNNGTINSPGVWNADGYEFTQGRCQVKDSAIIGSNNSWTIMALLSTTQSAVDTGKPIFCERPKYSSEIIKLDSCDYTTKYSYFLTWRNNAGNLSQIRSSITINDGLNHFLVVTKDGTSVRLFHNGKLDVTSTISYANTFTHPPSCYIAGDTTATAISTYYNFLGKISFIGVFLRSINSDEVLSLYENPWQIYQPRRVFFDFGASQQILNAAAGWRVLTLKDIPSAWDVLAEKESAAAWHVQAEKQESSGWDVLAEKQDAAAWNVLAEKQQSASWRILASRQAVAAWYVLYATLAAISWHVLTLTQVPSAWRVLAQKVTASGWMIFTRKVVASSWSILASGPKVVATAWRVLAERPAAASWHVLTQRSAASGWRVLASKAGTTGWRLLNALVAASSWIIGAIASGHETIRLKSPITLEIKGKSEITTEVNLESKIW